MTAGLSDGKTSRQQESPGHGVLTNNAENRPGRIAPTDSWVQSMFPVKTSWYLSLGEKPMWNQAA